MKYFGPIACGCFRAVDRSRLPLLFLNYVRVLKCLVLVEVKDDVMLITELGTDTCCSDVLWIIRLVRDADLTEKLRRYFKFGHRLNTNPCRHCVTATLGRW